VHAPAAAEFADVVAQIGRDHSRFALAELNALLTHSPTPFRRRNICIAASFNAQL
jgi:hypothetical protein